MNIDDARGLLKEAVRRRRRKKKGITIGERAAKAYTSPVAWGLTGAGLGAGTALLGTKRGKGGITVSRIPRKHLAMMMGLWGAASSAAETIIDRVAFGKAYRTRKRQRKLWKAERKL
jgi:hypothetical protein